MGGAQCSLSSQLLFTRLRIHPCSSFVLFSFGQLGNQYPWALTNHSWAHHHQGSFARSHRRTRTHTGTANRIFLYGLHIPLVEECREESYILGTVKRLWLLAGWNMGIATAWCCGSKLGTKHLCITAAVGYCCCCRLLQLRQSKYRNLLLPIHTPIRWCEYLKHTAAAQIACIITRSRSLQVELKVEVFRESLKACCEML